MLHEFSIPAVTKAIALKSKPKLQFNCRRVTDKLKSKFQIFNFHLNYTWYNNFFEAADFFKKL